MLTDVTLSIIYHFKAMVVSLLLSGLGDLCSALPCRSVTFCLQFYQGRLGLVTLLPYSHSPTDLSDWFLSDVSLWR